MWFEDRVRNFSVLSEKHLVRHIFRRVSGTAAVGGGGFRPLLPSSGLGGAL